MATEVKLHLFLAWTASIFCHLTPRKDVITLCFMNLGVMLKSTLIISLRTINPGHSRMQPSASLSHHMTNYLPGQKRTEKVLLFVLEWQFSFHSNKIGTQMTPRFTLH
jgi:hypothetical protein